MKRTVFRLIMAIVPATCFAQSADWEPQKQVTGYIATEGEYFKNLLYTTHNYGMSLSEAGLLVNYLPTQNITFKSVFVYRPDLSIDQMLNEASFEYKTSDLLKFKVGRFLTPLSPMNTYYYAPVNNSVNLPMIISHHEIFPLNIDALSINGVVGENFKADYNVFAGGYHHSLWLKTGPVGFMGVEDDYFRKIGQIEYAVKTDSANSALGFGGGGHVGISYKDIATIGFNMFTSNKEIMAAQIPIINPLTGQPVIDPTTGLPATMILDFNLEKMAYGINLTLKLENFQLIGELWRNNLRFVNTQYKLDLKKKVDGLFAEASYTFNKITPYVRGEYHNAAETKFWRTTAGLNYKPIFETTFKLEYVRYDFNYNETSTTGTVEKHYGLNGIVGSIIYSF